jgi:hypothetical protein
MGAVKNMIIDLEEKCFDQVAEQISHCVDIAEAQEKAHDIFLENGLLECIDNDYLEESVSEMWADQFIGSN